MNAVYLLSSERLDRLFGLKQTNGEFNLEFSSPMKNHYSAQQFEIMSLIGSTSKNNNELDVTTVFVIDSIKNDGLFRVVDVGYKHLSPRDVSPYLKYGSGNYKQELVKYFQGEYYHQTNTRVVVASKRIVSDFKEVYGEMILNTLAKKILK